MSTMSDRELLILAAKAAGIELWPGDPWCSFTPEFEGVRTKDGRVLWRPQQDDGDALRLAVVLNMHFKAYKDDQYDFVCAGVENPDYDHYLDPSETKWLAELDSRVDRFAAARRAILLAASEIGKAMP